MTDIIDDDLVEMVAAGICDADGDEWRRLLESDLPWERTSVIIARRRARAALAVAVPVIGERCAEVAADYEPSTGESADFWNGAAHAADDIDTRIRALTKGETG